jgi:hypothetical protein
MNINSHIPFIEVQLNLIIRVKLGCREEVYACLRFKSRRREAPAQRSMKLMACRTISRTAYPSGQRPFAKVATAPPALNAQGSHTLPSHHNSRGMSLSRNFAIVQPRIRKSSWIPPRCSQILLLANHLSSEFELWTQ